jgi:serine/threonine kinase PknH
MTSPQPPDRWPSQPSMPEGFDEPDLNDADTGPLAVPTPPLPTEERWHAGQGTWADKFDAPLIVNPRPVRRRERKPMVFLSAVSVLIVVVVGFLIFWLVRPSSDTAGAPPSAAPTKTSPDADRLLRLIPAGYPSDECKPVDAPKNALAQVRCDRNFDAGGPLAATYTLVDNKAALDAAFNVIVQAATRVNCPGNIQSPGPWRRNATPDKTSGVLFCGVRDGRPTVVWTDDARLVVSEVQSGAGGPSFDELYAWWSSHS